MMCSDLFKLEYAQAESDLHLSRADAWIAPGQRLLGRGVDYGKKRDMMTIGNYGPQGLDLLVDATSRGPGAVSATFRDGAEALASASSPDLRAYCSCQRPICPHVVATLYLAAGAEPCTWGDERAHRQLVARLADWVRSPESLQGILLACDAGYVRLRDAEQVTLGDTQLRDGLGDMSEPAARLRASAAPRALNLRQELARPRSRR